MDFVKSLNDAINNILGGQMTGGQMSGGEMNGGSVWTYVALIAVALVAVGTYLYIYEYFGCGSGRVSVDNKCVDMCPKGTTFANVNKTNDKMVDCVNEKGSTVVYDMPKSVPTPTPTSAPAPATTTPAS
jgi:hypothetical protein